MLDLHRLATMKEFTKGRFGSSPIKVAFGGERIAAVVDHTDRRGGSQKFSVSVFSLAVGPLLAWAA